MKFEFIKKPLDSISSDVVIVFAFEGKDSYQPTGSFVDLDKKLEGLLSEVAKQERFEGKEGSVLTIFTNKKLLAPKVQVLGLGKKEKLTGSALKKVGAGIAKKRSKQTSTIAFSLLENKDVSLDISTKVLMLAQGLLLGNYRFANYQKKKKEDKDLEMIILSTKEDPKRLQKGIEEAEMIYQATKLARDLVNEQATVATPEFLAKVAQDIAGKNSQIKCTVYDRKQAEKLGMGAFLGVARGSTEITPRFIHLEYTPKNYSGKKKLAIVGKAITYDTGGVSLKPPQYLANMKLDMAGGAAVLGIFSIIAEINPAIPVMGVFAATPNVVSATSYVPSDVLRAMNGKTIEVLNTDAEGRVTLADSLSYVVKKGATQIIDLATLTGASEVALGPNYAALFSNNEELKKDVLKAAADTGEKVWELPLVAEYKELIKSDVADIANLSAIPYGGAITAALFLEEFIDNKPWAHVDIAGPAFAEKDHDAGPKGATGFGVQMLTAYLSHLKE